MNYPDLKNIFGWEQVAGETTQQQFHNAVFSAYLRVNSLDPRMYEADAPGWNDYYNSVVANAPLAQWAAEWAIKPWTLYTAQGTPFTPPGGGGINPPPGGSSNGSGNGSGNSGGTPPTPTGTFDTTTLLIIGAVVVGLIFFMKD